MNITLKKGFVLVSSHDIVKEKKAGTLIMANETKRSYYQLESDGETYKNGDKVFAHEYKQKRQVDDNLFIIPEEDILAKFTQEEVI